MLYRTSQFQQRCSVALTEVPEKTSATIHIHKILCHPKAATNTKEKPNEQLKEEGVGRHCVFNGPPSRFDLHFDQI